MARKLTEEEQQLVDEEIAQRGEDASTRQLTAEEVAVFDKALRSSVTPVTPDVPLYMPLQNAQQPYGQEELRDASPPRRGGLSAQVEDLDPVAERLDKLVVRARSVVDRINGTRPRPGERAEVEKQPAPSIITTLRLKRDRMARAIDLLERELSALEECL